MEQKQELESTSGYMWRKRDIHLGKEGEGDKIKNTLFWDPKCSAIIEFGRSSFNKNKIATAFEFKFYEKQG